MCDEDVITASGGFCMPVSSPPYSWGDWKPVPLSRRRRVALAVVHGREAVGRRLVTIGHRMAGYPCGEDQDDWL